MTKTETARILTLIAAFDRRTIGETDVEAWHLILADLDAEDCAAAVRDHYTHRRDWLMPADVRSFAVAAQRRREGQTRLAALERQVQVENPPAEPHARPVAALTVGQPMPAPARLMRTEVASRRRQDTEADVAARNRIAEAREQARRELEEVRAASTPPAASDTATSTGATSTRSTEGTS